MVKGQKSNELNIVSSFGSDALDSKPCLMSMPLTRLLKLPCPDAQVPLGSTNAWMRERAMRTGFVRRSVVKFMPGERVEDAIEAAKALKPQGITTILTRLGENITQIEEADEVRDHYLRVIDLCRDAGLDAQVSVKPTQLGFDQDLEVCFRHCIDAARDVPQAANNFLWLDMESSPYVDGTIALFKRLRERSPKVGIAIQAYLYRTEKDIEELVTLGSAIRLVKGAYLEPAAVAYPKKSDVDANYFKLASRLLQDDNTQARRARSTSPRTTSRCRSGCSR